MKHVNCWINVWYRDKHLTRVLIASLKFDSPRCLNNLPQFDGFIHTSDDGLCVFTIRGRRGEIRPGILEITNLI